MQIISFQDTQEGEMYPRAIISIGDSIEPVSGIVGQYLIINIPLWKEGYFSYYSNSWRYTRKYFSFRWMTWFGIGMPEQQFMAFTLHLD